MSTIMTKHERSWRFARLLHGTFVRFSVFIGLWMLSAVANRAFAAVGSFGITRLWVHISSDASAVLDGASAERLVMEDLAKAGVSAVNSAPIMAQLETDDGSLEGSILFDLEKGCAFNERVELAEPARRSRDGHLAMARTGVWASWGWAPDEIRCAEIAKSRLLDHVRGLVREMRKARDLGALPRTGLPDDVESLKLHVPSAETPISSNGTVELGQLVEGGVSLEFAGFDEHSAAFAATRRSIREQLENAGIRVTREDETFRSRLVLVSGAWKVEDPALCGSVPTVELREQGATVRTGAATTEIVSWRSPRSIKVSFNKPDQDQICEANVLAEIEQRVRGFITTAQYSNRR